MACEKLLFSSGLIFIAAVALITAESPISEIYHLPDYIIPKHYNVKLVLEVEKDNRNKYNLFPSKCEINIEILKQTKNIYLHGIETQIAIWSTKLISDNGTSYTISEYQYFPHLEILNFKFNNRLIGNYILKIKFKIFNNLNNFFSTSHNIVVQKENKIWESISATTRQIFPCWDEPRFKATFNISVKHLSKYIVLSNMPVRATKEQYGIIWTRFDKTIPMPTYLITIVVLPRIFNHVHFNQRMSVLSRFDINRYTKFAQSIAKHVISLLEMKWEEINIIPKIDYIAVPDFWYDSMSTIGLVYYRENHIIYNNKIDPIGRKIEIARLIAYDTTYQLFNGIISPTSWRHLWLHEGLSLLIGMDTLDEIFVHLKIMDTFIVQNQFESLQLNSYLSVIKEKEYSTTKFSEFNSLFVPRRIKAFCLLRMLQHLLTSEIFNTGIHLYLHKYKFTSTTSKNLWHSMQIAFHKHHKYLKHKPHIKELMDTWIQQNYPILNVIPNYNTGFVNITVTNYKEMNTIWIPYTHTKELAPDFDETSIIKTKFLKCTPKENKSSRFRGKVHKRDNWIILNLQQTGYYRVNYDTRNWQALIKYLNKPTYNNIHVLNRAKLIDDAFYFLLAGELEASTFWSLANYMNQETEFAAWYPMFKVFEYMSTILPFSDKRVDVIKLQMDSMLDGVLKKIGYYENISNFTKNSKENNARLRQEAAKWACLLKNSDCMLNAREQFQILITDEKAEILPWWKNWIICNGFIALNINWKHLSDVIDNQLLGCSDNEETIIAHLKLIASKKDYERIIIPSFHSIIVRQIRNNNLLDYVLSHFDELLPRKNLAIATLINIINHVYSVKHLLKISTFVIKYLNCDVSEKCYIIEIQDKLIRRRSQIDNQINNIQMWAF